MNTIFGEDISVLFGDILTACNNVFLVFGTEFFESLVFEPVKPLKIKMQRHALVPPELLLSDY